MKQKTHSWGIFVFIVLLFGLTACGDNAADAGESNEKAPEETTENTTSEEPTDEEEASNDETEETPKEEKEKEEALPSRASIEENFYEVHTAKVEIVDRTEEVTGIEVVDGDTIVVESQHGEETIDLYAIDAPELNLPDGTKDQNFGLKAFDRAEYWLGGLLLFERVEGESEDGHAQGYIWIEQKTHDFITFNEKMLRDGLARLSAPTDAEVAYMDLFREAEEQAKAEQLDIWSIDGYVTENGFQQ